MEAPPRRAPARRSTFTSGDHARPVVPLDVSAAGCTDPAGHARARRSTRARERDDEDAIYGAAGFGGPQRLEVPGWAVQRSRDDVVAAVHSLSWAAPHLFGD